MSFKKLQVILTGSIAIDKLMEFQGSIKEHLTTNSDTISISLLLSNLTTSHGGVAANIAYTLALLGEKPFLVGSAGSDAKEYLNKLKKIGVDTSNVYKSLQPTASFSVITDSHENQFGGFFVGAMADSVKANLKKWYGKNVIVVISPNYPQAMTNLIKECLSQKLNYMYDFGQQVSNCSSEELKSGVLGAEIIIANDFEMGVLAKKTGISLDELNSQVPVCITTLGEKGSIISGKNIGGKKLNIKSVKVNKCVDPTGAGDAYRAGFLYGLSKGLDLQTCGEFGSVSASFAIEYRGTQVHSFNKTLFMKRYNKFFPKKG